MDVLAAVTGIKTQAQTVAAAFDPQATVPSEAARIAQEAARAKNILAGIEAAAAQAAAEANQWRRDGHPSPEAWLAAKTGTSPGAAKKRLATAKRVRNQDKVRDAVAQGELSPEQTEKVADAVAADPTAEERLLDAAKQRSLRELGEECDRTKAAADPDPDGTYARIHRERCLRFWSQAGVAKMLASCTPHQMAAIIKAVETRADELFHHARKSGEHLPREAYMMDALEHICRAWLGETPPANPAPDHTADDEPEPEHSGDPAAGTTPALFPLDSDIEDEDGEDEEHGGGDGGPGPQPPAPSGQPARSPSPPCTCGRRGGKAPPYLGLIRVDHSALIRGQVEGDELCEITGIGPVPVNTARRLLSDAVLYLILTKGSAVATTVNLKRGPTRAQRIALLWNQPICGITGCNNPRVEADHERPWCDTRVTLLGWLNNICRHHHDLKTLHRWRIAHHPDGTTTMQPPDDHHPP